MYLRRDELKPYVTPPGEQLVSNLMLQLSAGASDWAGQFAALDEIRRLTAFAPTVLVSAGGSNGSGGGLGSIVESVVSLAESLRSALAKNALRCLGELFVGYGPRLNAKLDLSVQACVRRCADSNRFIADEADQTLREICHAASEGHLLGSLLRSLAGRKAAGLRSKVVWGLAMFAQRLGQRASKCRDLPALVEAVSRAVADSSPDVRLSAKAAAIALVAGDLEGRLAGSAGAEVVRIVHAAVPDGVDLNAFDAQDYSAIQRLQGHQKASLPKLPAPSCKDGRATARPGHMLS